ncbi:MAG TPA: Cof-type HAD-IIB family hydrolase [Bacillales bacterium]|nr:Cof-type HAD-IIB family hydrolase [Bacillales bacterium]
MVYRMLALDIDGTLLHSNDRLDRRTKDAIAFVKRKDVYVTLVTERHFHSAKKVAKALKLDTKLITQNGAFIASEMDQPLYEKRLSAELVNDIVDVLEDFDCHVRVSHERFSVGNRVRQKSELIAKMTIGMTDPLFYPVTFVDSLSDYLVDHSIAPTKVDVHFFDQKERDAAMAVMRSEFPETTVSCNGKECEIVAERVSKANGLAMLAEALGIQDHEIVAVGDSWNDKEMIAAAGLGVAMKNAPREVKNIADWVTRSNDQNGVSFMVKEVFRKQLGRTFTAKYVDK